MRLIFGLVDMPVFEMTKHLDDVEKRDVGVLDPKGVEDPVICVVGVPEEPEKAGPPSI
jgi:hypothetical protein